MVACPKCGSENSEGAPLCGSCGTELGPKTAPSESQAARPEGKPFERQMEDLGKKLAGTGQQVGEQAGKMGSDFERMWYGTLGILAPVIGGLIATAVFVIFLLVVGSIAPGSEHRAFWEDLRDFLEANFLLFVGLFFLSSVTNYLNKVRRDPFRWITPVMTAVGFTAWCWILAQVLFIGADGLTRPGLRDLGDSLTLFLPVIFVIVLIIGYLVSIFGATKEKVAITKT